MCSCACPSYRPSPSDASLATTKLHMESMSWRLTRRSLLAIGLLALAGASPASAQQQQFYQGKRITLVVGFNPGGGIDTAGRLIAKHLGRFIPGNPGVTVQNMEGAGGVIAANCRSRAGPDGRTLGVPGRRWFIVGAVKNPAAKFDPGAMS